MSKVTDEIMGHGADNDGIEEYDNPLPDWWTGLFLFTIVAGIGYGVWYHFVAQTSQIQLYEAEMAMAAERWPQGEAPATLAFDAETLAAGKVVFDQTCASCHNVEMTGGIGPNLLDAEWIHGAEPEQVRTTVNLGVPAKGMPAWGQVLGPDKVAKVSAYVVSRFRETGLTPVVAAAAAAPAPAPAAANDGAPVDPLVAGEEVFKLNCVACHGADLTGGVGPNLIDAEWIHGGELDQIKATITNGVLEKGMVAWGPILGEEKIDQVARYVHDQANGAAGTAAN